MRSALACFATALIGAALVTSPSVAHATDLLSEAGIVFDIQDGLGSSFGSDGSMSDGGGDAYDGCYSLTVNGTGYFPSGTTMVTMGGRQLELPEMTIGTLSVRRVVYVPATGRSYARYLEVLENTGSADAPATVAISGNLGSDSGTIVSGTSSGDTVVSTADLWFATNDGGSFDPPLAHVFQGTTGAIRASAVSLSGDNLSYSYTVSVPAGGRVVIMHFAVQRRSAADAESDAMYLVDAPDDALVGADAWVDDIANFGVAVPGAPRVRFDGPFTVVEGDAFALDITVEDPEGDTATWSWDLNDDGTFGDMPGATHVDIPAGTTDGPGGVRIGVEASDGTNVAQRYRVVNITNVAPTIISNVTSNLISVGQRWNYALRATDPAGDLDPLMYTVVRGPDGMIVDDAGIVMWAPGTADVTLGEERVVVVLSVDDGDEGRTEQMLSLQVTPNHAPPMLALLYPSGGVSILDTTPRLAVTSAIDEDFDALTYFFELDDDEDFSSPLVSVGPLPEGAGYTALELTEPLANGHYFWRAWAFDGAAHGEPRSTDFRVVSDPSTVDAAMEIADGGLTEADAGGGGVRSGCSASPSHGSSSLSLLGLALLGLIARARRRC